MVPLPSHVHPLQGNGQRVTTDVRLHSLFHRDDLMVHRGNAMVPTSAISHLDHNLRTLIVDTRHPAIHKKLVTRTTASLVHSTTDPCHLMPDLVLVLLDHDLTTPIDVSLEPTTIISPVTRHQSDLSQVSHNPGKALPTRTTVSNAEQELVGFVDNSGATLTFTSMTVNDQGLHPRHIRETTTGDRPRAFGLPHSKTARITQSRPRQHSHACPAICEFSCII